MPTESAAHRLIPHLRRIARPDDATDAQLFAAFTGGNDEAAFAALVRRHGPTVLGVCRRVVGDVHLAEDAFQATFLVLARRAATVRPRELGAWLYGVAYRTALKARGSAARRRVREQQVEAMPHPTAPAAEIWADLQPVLDEELARLPDKYRGPLVLCDLGGRTQRAVARELGLAPATLANRLAAGRKVLAKRLTDRGVVLSAGAVAAALGWHAATQAVSSRLSAATVQLVCASAAGTSVGLPPQVVELSEGVMRMFLVSKLKAVAVGGLSVAILLTGLGLVTRSEVQANPDDQTPPAKPARQDPRPVSEPDDLKYLRRVSLDLRGTTPSAIEVRYFLADTDAAKRGKVVEWMLPEHGHRPVNAGCTACHDTGKVPVLGELPLLGHLYRKVGVHDLSDVRVDAGGLRVLVPTLAAVDLEGARAALEAAAIDRVVAEHDARERPAALTTAELERARASYVQAQAAFRLAERAAKPGPPPGPATTAVQNGGTFESLPLGDLARALGLPTDDTARPPGKASEIDVVHDRLTRVRAVLRLQGTDAEFLRRVSLDVRGVPPSKIEENYFDADPDPKKREKLVGWMTPGAKPVKTGDKLVDEFLTDPEVAKQYAAWRKKKAEEEARLAARVQLLGERYDLAARMPGKPDALAVLLKNLQAGTRSDEHILDAVCLATVARFPTDAEKKLVLEVVGHQADRKAAWDAVAQALAGTPEAKAHAEGLGRRAGK